MSFVGGYQKRQKKIVADEYNAGNFFFIKSQVPGQALMYLIINTAPERDLIKAIGVSRLFISFV